MRRRLVSRPLALAIIVLGAGWLGWCVAEGDHEPVTTVTARGSASVQPGTAGAPLGAERQPARAAEPAVLRVSQPQHASGASTDLPPGVPAATWQALRAELAAQPSGPAELRRLAAYYRWTDAWSRWRELRDGGASPAELAALTAEVEAGVADRLSAREMGAGEAWQVMAALRAADTPDPDERERQLQAWADTRPGGAFGPGQTDPRTGPFAAAQTQALAAWRHEVGQDPAALQRRLTALRQTHFAADPAASAGR